MEMEEKERNMIYLSYQENKQAGSSIESLKNYRNICMARAHTPLEVEAFLEECQNN